MRNSTIITFIAVIILVVLGYFVYNAFTDDQNNANTNGVLNMNMNENQNADTQNQTIEEILSQDDQFRGLAGVIEAAGLNDELGDRNATYTVFAPRSQALQSMQSALDDLRDSDSEQLTAIVEYHIVQGEMMIDDLRDGQTVTTLSGETLRVSVSNGDVMVNDASVVQPNIQASNGVIHVIDAVLIPETEANQNTNESQNSNDNDNRNANTNIHRNNQ